MNENVQKLIDSLSNILIGKRDVVTKIVVAFLAGGNILLEDMPGVGKTIVSKSLSRLIYKKSTDKLISFSRIQGTPDLLPYDITGVDIYNADKKEFVFKPGPIFTDILLADELNRTTPKVQSALLQAMAERLVTVGNKTYHLSDLFFVIATQNPVETDGTYPLPVAQLDRFAMRLAIGYPDFDNELSILKSGKSEDKIVNLSPVISDEEINEIRAEIKKINIDEKILHVIAKICQKSREQREIRMGLSTRAALSMVDMLKANAYIARKTFVTDQDIIELAMPVWAHRLLIDTRQVKVKDILSKIVREELRKVMFM